MAFYTGQATIQTYLPRTPDVYLAGMNVNASSLLNNTWSTWRGTAGSSSSSGVKDTQHSHQTQTPLTPPMTSTFQSRTTSGGGSSYASNQHQHDVPESTSDRSTTTMTLPPIAHLERHIHNLPPLTPPEDLPIPVRTPSRLVALPKITSLPQPMASVYDAQQPMLHYHHQHQEQGHPVHQQQYTYHEQQQPLPSTSTALSIPQSVASSSQSSFSQTPSHSSSSSQSTNPTPSHSQAQSTNPTPTTTAAQTTIATLALAPAPPAYLVDWLDFTRTRSAHFIAEKTCEMICYLWFSIPAKGGDGSPVVGPVDGSPSATATASTNASKTTTPSTLQLSTSPTFVTFMQKLLETTQVSQSVIVLSLHYIHRLKAKNHYMPAQPGSEFRIGVAGLMMANKFLDDNTYTNKTWSEVSGISLDEINRMEREFLLGVDFNLYVDKPTYASWLNLLKGLVMAKERDARRFMGGSSGAGGRAGRVGRGREKERGGRGWERKEQQGYQSHAPSSRTYTSAAATANAVSNAHANTNGLSANAVFGTTANVFGVSKSSTTSSSSTHPVSYGAPSYGHGQRHRARSTSPQMSMNTSSSTSTRAVSHSQYGQQQQQTYQAYQYPQTQVQQPTQQTTTQQYYTQPTAQPSQSAYTYPTSSTSTSSSTTQPVSMDITPSSPAPGPRSSKRSADDAFSPPPASAPSGGAPAYRDYRDGAQQPQSKQVKGPVSMYGGLQLQIPEGSAKRSPDYSAGARQGQGQGSTNVSPLEGLHGFEQMSLGPAAAAAATETQPRTKRAKKADDHDMTTAAQTRGPPRALVAPYTYDLGRVGGAEGGERRQGVKNLYFYTLACSPSADERERDRERERERRMDVASNAPSSPLSPVPALAPATHSGHAHAAHSDASSSYTYPHTQSPETYHPTQYDTYGRNRKAKLRYHPAPSSSTHVSGQRYDYADLNMGMGIGGTGRTVYNYATTAEKTPALVPATASASASARYVPHTFTTAAPTTSAFSASTFAQAPASAQPAFSQPHTHTHAYTHQPALVRALPAVVQSATSSPALPMPLGLSSGSGGALPHFRDDVWARPPVRAQPPSQAPPSSLSRGGRYEDQQQQHDEQPADDDDESMDAVYPEERERSEDDADVEDGEGYESPPPTATAASAFGVQQQSQAVQQPQYSTTSLPSSTTSSPYHASYSRQQPESYTHQASQYPTPQHSYQSHSQSQHQHQHPHPHIPSAPFANAGPPGVGAAFYHTPEVGPVPVPLRLPASMFAHGPSHASNAGSGTTWTHGYGSASATHTPLHGHQHAHNQHHGQPQAGTPGYTYTYSGAHSTSNSPYHSAYATGYSSSTSAVQHGYDARSAGY